MTCSLFIARCLSGLSQKLCIFVRTLQFLFEAALPDFADKASPARTRMSVALKASIIDG
jgi:hypothetical protein